MSAMNAFLSPQAVHIATDGAGYLPDGRTVCGVQKVAILAHLPCVIAVRGAIELLSLAAEAATRGAQTFDALASRVGAFCKAVHQTAEAGAEAYGQPFPFTRSDFLIAGWSEARGRLETYAVTSAADGEFEPWTARLYFGGDDTILSPYTDEVGAAVDAIEAELGGDLAAKPEAAALRVIEVQRALRLKDFADSPCGVFCQLTTLTREGISTKILRRWPDAKAA